jgi:hypothetical protein
MKQIEAYAVWENNGWVVITIIVKYFQRYYKMELTFDQKFNIAYLKLKDKTDMFKLYT